MSTEPLTHRAAELIVGMTAESVKDQLGLPLREEDISFKDPRQFRWYYPEGLVVKLSNRGDGLKLTQWAWRLTHCPKCGKKLGEGVTRCWAKGCDYVVVASIGTIPLVELPDGRMIMAHWAQRPARGNETPTREWTWTPEGTPSRRREWTLTLEGKPFRILDWGQWRETLGYGPHAPLDATCSQAPDGRLLVCYSFVELLVDIEKMKIEYEVLYNPHDSWDDT